MAENTVNISRQWAVKERSQTYNPKTECFIKRDTKTGKFISCKKEEPYKGVKKENNLK